MVGSCSCAPVWAGGVGLDAGGHQLELAAEILHFALWWLRRRCVGIEKAVLALERIACTSRPRTMLPARSSSRWRVRASTAGGSSRVWVLALNAANSAEMLMPWRQSLS